MVAEPDVPFTVRVAERSGLEAILAVQRDGFGRISSMLGIPAESLPPLVETLGDLEALFDAGTRFFAAVTPGGDTIGTVRATEADTAIEVGRLAVARGWTRRGVATALMDALEAAYPHAERFVLFTGSTAEVPLILYRSRGYVEYRREELGHVELVWLEKRVGNEPPTVCSTVE